jgi:hypothetical protein
MKSSKMLISDVRQVVRGIKQVQNVFKGMMLTKLKGTQSGGAITMGKLELIDLLKYEISKLNDIILRRKRRGKQIMDQARALRSILENELNNEFTDPKKTLQRANESTEWRKVNNFWSSGDTEKEVKAGLGQLKLIDRLRGENPNIDFTKSIDVENKKLNDLLEMKSRLKRAERIQEKQRNTRAGYKDITLYAKNLEAKNQKKLLRIRSKASYERRELREKEAAKKRLKKERELLATQAKSDEAADKYKKWEKIATKTQDAIWEAKDKNELRKALTSSFAAQDGMSSSMVDYIANSKVSVKSGLPLDALRTEVNNINKLYMLDEPTKSALAAIEPKRAVILKTQPSRLKRKREVSTPPVSSIAYNTRSRSKIQPVQRKIKKRRRR